MPTFAREKDTRVDRWLPHKQKKICFYCREVARHGSRFAGYCNFIAIFMFQKSIELNNIILDYWNSNCFFLQICKILETYFKSTYPLIAFNLANRIGQAAKTAVGHLKT